MDEIEDFLGGPSGTTRAFAVAGASNDRSKFGNRVLRCYWAHGFTAYAVNPRENAIEGQPCYPSLSALPEPVHGVSLITPPEVSERIVEDAAAAGIRRLWFQPGAESRAALALAEKHAMSVIAGGPCLLVVLPSRARGAGKGA